MFVGTFTPKLDEKGRLIFPAKFREALSNGLVMTRGQEHCVTVYPMREFEQLSEDLRKAPTTSREARDYLRVLLSGASDEVPDKQGRITIPPQLRTYARLDRECTVIGVGNRLEIWATTAWDTYLAEQEESFAETASEVVPGLF